MKSRLMILSFALMLTGLVANTVGQVTGEPYRINDQQVGRLLDRIKNQTDRFRNSLKDSLNRSRLNRTERENEINDYVRAFEEDTKRLDDHFDNHRSTSADVDAVLNRAARIDGFMSRQSLGGRATTDWTTLRASLEELASAYSVNWRWDGYSPIGSRVSDAPYRLTDREVEQIIHRIESQSDRFRSSLDAALDRSRLDGTKREDDINGFVKGFYEETKRLHDHFDSHRSTSADVQSVLDRAASIDQFMYRYPLNARARNDWTTLKGNLDELAQVYSVTWRWGGYLPPAGGVPTAVPPIYTPPYRITDREVEQIIRRLETQSDQFRSSLDAGLDRSRLDGTRREDDINSFVSAFTDETRRLRERFDARQSTSADLQSVLDRAARIDQFMRRYRLTERAQNDWASVKAVLDELARVYVVQWRWGY